MSRASILGPVACEFDGAQLGDARRSGRLLQIAHALDAEPVKGFPQALGSESEVEAFYRFINNDGFSADNIMRPHVGATMARARAARDVIVVHDTTVIDYDASARREGLGYTTERRQGFYAHVSLMLAADGLPLGVGHIETYTRTGSKKRAPGRTSKVVRDDDSRESLRWLRAVEAIESARDEKFDAVHVTDAEGDFFELLATMDEDEARFVVRAGQLDRIVDGPTASRSLRDVVNQIEERAWRDVDLTERKHRHADTGRNSRRKHPERPARGARLAIGAARITLLPTKYCAVETGPFELNVVRVWEPSARNGQVPIEWVLLTTEDVSSTDALMRVVDIYRLRWTIEEFFKALKTGCSLEKRQVESFDALRNVLALFAPIAYRLLLLRALQRGAPDTPARRIFSDVEVRLMERAPSNRGMKPLNSVADALLHLARLGGHLKNNGPPGWLTLSRGYEKLLTLRLGWTLAQESLRNCDQS